MASARSGAGAYAFVAAAGDHAEELGFQGGEVAVEEDFAGCWDTAGTQAARRVSLESRSAVC